MSTALRCHSAYLNHAQYQRYEQQFAMAEEQYPKDLAAYNAAHMLPQYKKQLSKICAKALSDSTEAALRAVKARKQVDQRKEREEARAQLQETKARAKQERTMLVAAKGLNQSRDRRRKYIEKRLATAEKRIDEARQSAQLWRNYLEAINGEEEFVQEVQHEDSSKGSTIGVCDKKPPLWSASLRL